MNTADNSIGYSVEVSFVQDLVCNRVCYILWMRKVPCAEVESFETHMFG